MTDQVAALGDAALGLTRVGLAPCADEELLAALGAVEVARRQLAFTDVLEKVPAAARAEWAEQIEVSLVTHAAEHDPVTLAKIGRRLIDLLDPDGTLSDDADRARRRDLTLLIHPDGTGTLRGTTDAHLTELLVD